MNKIQIKPHNFHSALSNIKHFSQNLPADPSFDNVEVEGGLFGWGSHKVTGEEMNLFIGKVQERFIGINGTFRSIIHEFEEVYKAFNALDKEYVAGILQSVEEADKACRAAQKASEGNAKTIERLEKTIQILARTTQELKDFKEKVTDDLSSIAFLNTKIAHINIKIQTIKESFHQQVDSLVKEVNQATTRIDGDIEALKQYRTLLESYQHLGNVDTIWSDVEDHKTDLSGLHEKLDAFIRENYSEQERIKGLIHQMEIGNNLVHRQYNKKLKIAYWIGGSAAGLTVINYIFQIIGVL